MAAVRAAVALLAVGLLACCAADEAVVGTPAEFLEALSDASIDLIVLESDIYLSPAAAAKFSLPVDINNRTLEITSGEPEEEWVWPHGGRSRCRTWGARGGEGTWPTLPPCILFTPPQLLHPPCGDTSGAGGSAAPAMGGWMCRAAATSLLPPCLSPPSSWW